MPYDPQAFSALPVLSRREDDYREQLARALALSKPSGQHYSSTGGILFGGLGDLARQIGGGVLEYQARSGLGETQRQHEAIRAQAAQGLSSSLPSLADVLAAPDDVTASAKSQSLLDALQGAESQARAGLMSGDPTIAPAAQMRLREIEAARQQLAAAPEQRLARGLKSQQLKQETLETEDQAAPANPIYTEMARKFGYTLQPGATNKQAREILGLAEKAYSAEQRAQEIKLARDARSDAKGAIADAKEEAFKDKLVKAMGADLDPNGGRAGEFGKNQARVNASDRMMQLVKGPGGYDLDPQQMVEFSSSLASLIAAGGQAAQSQIEHLTPKSVSGDWAKVQQWLTSEPHGAGQRAFVEKMVHTAERERELALSKVRDTQRARLSKHQTLKQKYPDAFSEVLQEYGLTETPAAASHPQDDQALAWAKANPGDPRAKAILKANGATP